MNHTTIRIAQTISIAVLTAFFLAVARVEITQTYFGAAVVVSVVLTGFGTWGVLWLMRRRRSRAG